MVTLHMKTKECDKMLVTQHRWLDDATAQRTDAPGLRHFLHLVPSWGGPLYLHLACIWLSYSKSDDCDTTASGEGNPGLLLLLSSRLLQAPWLLEVVCDS